MTLKISNFKLYHPTDQSILIEDLNLVVDYGDIIGIVGPNGSGKTLFLDSISGFNQNWKGNISLDDKNINNDFISYFVQDLKNNFFTETVEDEINYHLQNIGTTYTLDKVINYLNHLGIDYESIKELPPFVLSSIESKILTFVLSLQKPHKICLVDELDSGMILDGKSKLSKFLKENSNDKIILIVSHDNKFLENICSKIIKL